MQERINGFLALLRGLRPWQAGVLAAVLVGSAGATYGVYATTNGGAGARLGENQQLIPVQYGNLVNQVSTNGSLTFPERDALSFESAGRVAEVLVKEGELIVQGQVLAKLDAAALISLEEGAAEARVALRDAQNALAQLELEYAVELAQAEEAVAAAELARRDAREALEEARMPYSALDLRVQEQAVAAARVSLREAEQALKDLEPSYALQLGEGLKAQSAAQAALVEARRALDNFESDHALSLASAGHARAAAEVALEDARKALETYEKAQGSRIAEIRSDRATAEKTVADLQAQLDLLLAAQKTAPGDLTGRILSLRQALESNQDLLDGLWARTAELYRLEAQVELARKELAGARDELAILTPGPDRLRKQELEAAVKIAEADVALAARSLASLLPGANPLELALRQADLALAQETLAQAEEGMAEMQAGPNPLEVTLQERRLALAEADLVRARNVGESLSADTDPLELALRQAQVASAQRALDQALTRLENATLRSPIDGLVSRVNVKPGEEVQASAITVEVVDTTIVEIDGIVDEIDVLSIREGIPVQVSLDAVPGRTFEGVVAEIASAAQGQQGVVTYPISIQMEVPADLNLREGLTAVARIILDEERDVLLVPQQALYGTFDQPLVRVMTSNGIQERPVSLGNSDGFWVAVRDGIQEGDRVVMESAAASTTGGGFGQIRGVAGGGFGGPGGGIRVR